MPLCTSCNKSLKSEAALIQHCRDKAHPYNAPVAPASSSTASTSATAAPSTSTARLTYTCKTCGAAYTDKAALDQHNAAKHPSKPYKCTPCGLEFSSLESLGVHFRHFAIHPKCPQCGSAFVDQTQFKLHQAIHPKCSQCDSVFLNRTQLDQHVTTAHPAFNCNPCGRGFRSAEERKKHYQESSNHPICFVCGEGFADDSEVDNHLSRTHIDTLCRLCSRQFRLVEDLQNHFLTSAAHPHCAICEIGFADDGSCDMHMATNHPRPPPRVPSPPQALHVTITAATTEPSSLATQLSSQPARSPSVLQRPQLNSNATAQVLTTLRDASNADDDTYQTVEASSHVQRAISEPTLPTVSSVGYGSVHDGREGSWRSPTISERSLDYSNVRGMPRHPQSESTMSLRSMQSSISSSAMHSHGGSSYEEIPQAPLPSSLGPRVTETPQGERAGSLISQSASPHMVRSPINSTRSFSSLSEHLSRVVAPALRPSLSRQPSPRVPSPVLMPVRPVSRTSAAATPTPNGSANGTGRTSRAGSSLKQPAATTASAPLTSDTEETVPAETETPKAGPVPLLRPPPKAGAAYWHCRICKQDPCAVPTATMCGHIFCTACILQDLVKTGCCPVCGKMILLRLHVDVE